MKKYLLLLIILPFIFISPVNAVTSDDANQVVSNWILPNQVQCYNSSKQEITTNFNWVTLEVQGAYPKSYYNCYGGSNSYISLELSQLLQGDTLYSLSVYVGNTNSLVNNSNGDIGLGGYPLEAMNDNPNKNNVTIWSHRARGNFQFHQPTSGQLATINYTELLFVFNAKENGSVFNFHNTYSGNPGNIWIFGFNLEPLGRTNGLTQNQVQSVINQSGLAKASDTNEIKQSQEQIRQEITGMQQEQQQTNEKLDDLNDNITSEEEPTIDLDLDESSNTPISDLILFPITLLNKLINTIGNDTCSPYTLPFFYDTTITFPCFQLSNYLGTSITNSIDLFICLFMCYNLAMLFISIFEDITSLRDTYDSLYEPKHADTGYKPKHGKE